jgi:enamine deaminase RidA (YjgF/YER057c/UK114 family)
MTLGNIEAILQTACLSLQDVAKTTVQLHELDRDFGGV